MAESGLVAGGPLSALDSVHPRHVESLSIRVFRWLVNPQRKLGTGATLAEIAQDGLSRNEADADLRLGGFAKQAAEWEPDSALRAPLLTAPSTVRTGEAIRDGLVDRLLLALDNPGDDHCGQNGEFRKRLPPDPPIVADRKLLRQVLRSRPWALNSESAEWLVSTRIGYLRK